MTRRADWCLGVAAGTLLAACGIRLATGVVGPSSRCAACADKLGSGAMSGAGARAIAFLRSLSRTKLVTPEDATMLRVLLNPRTDAAFRGDDASAAPEHELLTVRCLATTYAGELLGSGAWLHDADRESVFCAVMTAGAGPDEAALRCARVAALARTLRSGASLSPCSAAALLELRDDPDAAVSFSAKIALATPKESGVHDRGDPRDHGGSCDADNAVAPGAARGP